MGGLVAGTVCVINVSVSPNPPMVARPVGIFSVCGLESCVRDNVLVKLNSSFLAILL